MPPRTATTAVIIGPIMSIHVWAEARDTPALALDCESGIVTQAEIQLTTSPPDIGLCSVNRLLPPLKQGPARTHAQGATLLRRRHGQNDRAEKPSRLHDSTAAPHRRRLFGTSV